MYLPTYAPRSTSFALMADWNWQKKISEHYDEYHMRISARIVMSWIWYYDKISSALKPLHFLRVGAFRHGENIMQKIEYSFCCNMIFNWHRDVSNNYLCITNTYLFLQKLHHFPMLTEAKSTNLPTKNLTMQLFKQQTIHVLIKY